MGKWGSKCLQGLIRFFIFPVVVVYTRVLFFFFFCMKKYLLLDAKEFEEECNPLIWYFSWRSRSFRFLTSLQTCYSFIYASVCAVNNFVHDIIIKVWMDRRLLIASFISSDAEKTNADWFFCFELQSLLQSHHQRVLRGMFWFHYWTRSCHSHHWSSLAFWQGYTVAFCEYGLNNRNIVCKYRSLAC